MYKSNQFCESISFILMLEIIQLRGALIQNELILFMPKLPFDSPKNIRNFWFSVIFRKDKREHQEGKT